MLLLDLIHNCINRYKYFENSAIMLFKLLNRLNPSKIVIAGFDGFDVKNSQNYMDSSYQNKRHVDEFNDLNSEIKSVLREIVETMYPDCIFEMITPSLFQCVLDKVYAR